MLEPAESALIVFLAIDSFTEERMSTFKLPIGELAEEWISFVKTE
jgi:hypothetical protein